MTPPVARPGASTRAQAYDAARNHPLDGRTGGESIDGAGRSESMGQQ